MKYFLLRPAKLFNLSTQSRAAYVLIELLVTCALVAFLCMLAIDGARLARYRAVASQAHMLRATCWYLQQRARALGQEQSVVFEEEKDQYVTSTGEVHKLVQNVHFGVIPGVAGPPAEPHESLSHAITFVQHKIIFHPTGVIQSGSAYLVDKDKQILYAVTVAVSGVSYVRLYKYDQQQWHLCT